MAKPITPTRSEFSSEGCSSLSTGDQYCDAEDEGKWRHHNNADNALYDNDIVVARSYHQLYIACHDMFDFSLLVVTLWVPTKSERSWMTMSPSVNDQI